jgi:predicted phosphodiesterase
MPYAVISDVHANLEALLAVLRDIEKRKVRGVLFLGDAVGYGPDPNECVSRLKEASRVLLAGNHDWASVGLTGIEYFNPYAQAAIRWTSKVLTGESRKAIKGFSLVKVMRRQGLFLVHSSPRAPEEWHYVLTREDAELNFTFFSERVCLLGHSHWPFIVERLHSGELVTYSDEAVLRRDLRYIINVGSVGQPRDKDPRACYALLEAERVRLVRVEYPVRETQRKMEEAGLPGPLIERLSIGA